MSGHRTAAIRGRLGVLAGALAVASLLLWQLVAASVSVPLQELFPLAVGVAALTAGLRGGLIVWAAVASYSFATYLLPDVPTGTLADLAAASVSLAGMACAGAMWYREDRRRSALVQALNERLGAMIRRAPVAIYSVEHGTDRVRLWNPAAERLFGWTAAEVLGRPLPSVPPDLHDQRRTLHQRALAGETVVGQETQRLHKDGSRRDVSLSLVALAAEEDGAAQLLSFAEDITERKHTERALHEALTELFTIVKQSPIAIYAVDAETDTVKLWNPAAERLFGWTAAEVLGRPLPTVPPHRRAARAESLRQLRAGAVITDREVPGLRKDGTLVDLSLSMVLVPAADGGHAEVLQFAVDTSERRRSQRELQRSREQYRQLVESASDVVYRTDLSGRFTFVNPVAERLTGRSEQELRRLRFLELVDPAYRRRVLSRYYRQLRARQPSSYLEFPVVRADGSRAWVGQNVQLIVSPEGEPIGFQGIARDISERRAAQDALARQYAEVERARSEVRAMLDATPDTMVFVGADGRVRAVNHAYYAHLGQHGVGDVVGRDIGELAPAWEALFENGQQLHDLVARTLHQPHGAEMLELHQRPPHENVLSVSSTPVTTSTGEFLGRLYVLRDVTEQRAVEQMKDHLLSMVSHELRTPLTSIMGYTELLLTDPQEPPTPRQAEFLQVVMDSTNQQLRLVNDLLELSHLSEHMVTLRRTPVDVGKAALTVSRALRPQAAEKHIKLKVQVAESGATAYADPERVEQVIRNLLSNAIKYTPEGGAVTVRVGTPAGRYVRVEVSDTGIGISNDEQAKVFTRFFRSPRAARAAAGTGLGLAIAKALVELQGGLIGFSSRENAGSTFWFTLPARPADVPAQATERAAPR